MTGQERQAASPEPLEHVAYVHDGTLEGLLSCIFAAYAYHEQPEDIVCEKRYQPRLLQSVRVIDTNPEWARRVRAGIERVGQSYTFRAIVRASASDAYDAGAAVYRFVRYLMDERTPITQRAHALDNLSDPVVSNLVSLEKHVINEEEHVRQFTRFSHRVDGVWFARTNPNASVVPLIMPYFAARFNMQPFVIYDETHHLAGAYDGSQWRIILDCVPANVSNAPDETIMREAWKLFYDSTNIRCRYHPELRRHFMPERLWKNLPEMEPRQQDALARVS